MNNNIRLVCPNCKENKGMNTGLGIGKLTCSNCSFTFPVDDLVEVNIS